MSATRTYPAEDAAAVVERLAALLAGGGAPSNAWDQLAEFANSNGANANRANSTAAVSLRNLISKLPWKRGQAAPGEPMESLVARAVRSGADPAELLRTHANPAWRALGATWRLAETTGAPLGPALRDLAAGFRDIGQSERDVAIALAAPQATSRIVMALPLVGLLLGALLGFDPIGVLFGDPIGWALLAIGGLLMLVGWWWNRRLVNAATNRPTTPGFGLDLVAMGMLGGNSAVGVLTAVGDALRGWKLEASGIDRAKPVVDLAVRAGVPASELLRSEALLERRRARTDAARAAAQLEVRLMLPLGACILPAFLALGVAPIVIAVLSRVLG
ncbi:MAG: type II secretion system F family protein [Gulosibacter sp.]|uniref:type II secretion system F family protein n=1 Tax=Gulosibacter sp. TaxID=2817531 RepID=UPI003F8DC034